MTTTSAASI